jgi:ADP-heptose:LPS heptosyltransferase
MSHVLVVRLDSDGDVLLSGPAVRAVAAGADRVSYLCSPRGRQAALLLPGVDEVRVWRCPWIDPDPPPVERREIEAQIESLAALRCDQAVILTSFHQSALPMALLLRMAGVATIAAVSEDYPGSLLDVRHRVEGELHEVERALSLVSTLGYALPDGDDGALRVLRPERDTAWIPFAGAPYVVVHPGASVPARAWSVERNAMLVEALAAEGHNVVVTGGPGERALTALVAGVSRPNVIDAAGCTTLAGLAEIIASSRAIVVGNTGPAHLAAAVGTPLVSLFPPTVPAARWRPWRVAQVLLGLQDVSCAGCRARVCPVAGHPCLNAVSVADVLDALGHLMSDRPSERDRVGV